MNAEHKADLITEVKRRMTPKAISFINNMKEGFGNLLKNNLATEKAVTEPDFFGYARLSNGTVVYIRGNVKESTGGLSIPLTIVEIPCDIIGENDGYQIEPQFPQSKISQSLIDRFLS